MDKPAIPAFAWPSLQVVSTSNEKPSNLDMLNRPGMNTSRKRSGASPRASTSDEFGFDDSDDAELINAAREIEEEFRDVDMVGPNSAHSTLSKPVDLGYGSVADSEVNEWEPIRLPNGKWECNHNCKDKAHCKHLCCREGTDAPRKPKPKLSRLEKERTSKSTEKSLKSRLKQTVLSTGHKGTSPSIRSQPHSLAELDMTGNEPTKKKANQQASDFQRAHGADSRSMQSSAAGRPWHHPANPADPAGRRVLSFLPRLKDLDHEWEAITDMSLLPVPNFDNGKIDEPQISGLKGYSDVFDAAWEEDPYDYDTILDATNAENEKYDDILHQASQAEEDEDLDKYFGRDTDFDELADSELELSTSLTYRDSAGVQEEVAVNSFADEGKADMIVPSSDSLSSMPTVKKRSVEAMDSSPLFEPDQGEPIISDANRISDEAICPPLKKTKWHRAPPKTYDAKDTDEEGQSLFFTKENTQDTPEPEDKPLQSSLPSASHDIGEELLLREFGSYIDFI
jgi:hypothetical protein